MDAMVSRSAAAVLAALAVSGCATTGQPAPTTTGTSPLSCEPIVYDKTVETTPAEKWNPAPKPRSYVHIRFVTDGGSVYAVVVPVVKLEPVDLAVVGPMDNLPLEIPENEEAVRAALEKYPRWRAFYAALFKGYRRWRPLGFACPGRDCPTTPEGPPPAFYGMTTSYGTSGSGSLEQPESSRALAELARSASSATATDALHASAAQTSPEQERDRRTLISDVVTRAVCAAKILSGSR